MLFSAFFQSSATTAPTTTTTTTTPPTPSGWVGRTARALVPRRVKDAAEVAVMAAEVGIVVAGAVVIGAGILAGVVDYDSIRATGVQPTEAPLPKDDYAVSIGTNPPAVTRATRAVAGATLAPVARTRRGATGANPAVAAVAAVAAPAPAAGNVSGPQPEILDFFEACADCPYALYDPRYLRHLPAFDYSENAGFDKVCVLRLPDRKLVVRKLGFLGRRGDAVAFVVEYRTKWRDWNTFRLRVSFSPSSSASP